MTPQIRHEIVQGRLTNYYMIMLTVFVTYSAVAAIDTLGGGGYSAPLTMLTVAVAAYGILAGGTTLDDVNNLRGDMDEAMSQTTYGKAVLARNIPALKSISSALVGLIGLAQLYALFT